MPRPWFLGSECVHVIDFMNDELKCAVKEQEY